MNHGYCQRWRSRRHSWRSPSEGGFDPSGYEVAAIAEADARWFVRDHHYSASYPAARLRYGLHVGDALVGVAVFSVPVRVDVLTSQFPFLVPYGESLELGRFVLLDEVPANAESWFLSRCFGLAQRDGLRGVVSFSDPLPRADSDGRVVTPGHVGTIYQATNAVHAGRGRARLLRLLPDGTVLNERTRQKIRARERGHEAAERLLVALGAPAPRAGEHPAAWLERAEAAVGVRLVRHPGNYRYAFALGGPVERRRILRGLDRLPYPKADL